MMLWVLTLTKGEKIVMLRARELKISFLVLALLGFAQSVIDGDNNY